MTAPLVSILTPVFRSEPYIQSFLEAVTRQSIFDRIELVLVMNQPSILELAAVQNARSCFDGRLSVQVVTEKSAHVLDHRTGHWALETYGQSMNRCVLAAQAPLVALWNVDDLRVETSLEQQLALLDAHPEVDLVYGDMVSVPRYGQTDGRVSIAPEFDRGLFMRGCFGAFQMWRKSVHRRCGLFDQQLRSGADFDLWVRLASNGIAMRCPRILGQFLQAGQGLSTRKKGLQPIECTVIELRYGIYDKLDYRYLLATRPYRWSWILQPSGWHHVSEFVPDYEAHMAACRGLLMPGVEHFIAERAAGLAAFATRAIRHAQRAAKDATRV